MDVADLVVKPMREFAKDSIRLVKRCTKPDRKGTFVIARTSASVEPRHWDAE